MASAGGWHNCGNERSRFGGAVTSARHWLERGAGRPWLWLQLGACAMLVALCVVDVLMVSAGVACATYRRTIQGLPGEIIAFSSLAIGGTTWVWRLLAQISLRQYRALAGSLALLALELALVLGAFEVDIDRTLFYCAFEGVSLNACEIGLCAR